MAAGTPPGSRGPRMLAARVLEHTLAYRAWQAPFAERKLAPMRRHGGRERARRVLDVGCGPGTNAHHFADADYYLGLDINPGYVADAARRHRARPGRREFVVADVTAYEVSAAERFDCILANSVFHHIATTHTRRILAHLATLLADDGHLHVLDLVLPERASVPRLLARWDRGEFPRPLDEWRAIFAEAFEPVVFEPYALGRFGATLWRMVYFKGRARR